MNTEELRKQIRRKEKLINNLLAEIREFRKEICRIEGHNWLLHPVAGEGYYCAKCSAWKPED